MYWVALNPKQAAFVREYLIDHNATQAAIRAGYSAKTARSVGSENLAKPDIKAAIDEASARVAEQTDITVAEIVEGLKSEAKGADIASARVQAWGLLAKYKQMFVERVEHSGANGSPISISINGVKR